MTERFAGIVDGLYDLYRDPHSGLFLETSTNKIYNKVRRDSRFYHVNRSDIERYKRSLTTLSKNRERRVLGYKRRHLSFRRWRTYGPLNCVLGDLAFLRSIRDHQEGKKYIILVLLDAFSRLCYLAPLKSTSSREVQAQFEAAFKFFGGKPHKFCSDKVNTVGFYFKRPSL